MLITLHDYRRCPFCIRVRIVLHLLHVEYERVHEPLRVWTPWMREKVQSGKIDRPRVPVLQVISDTGTEQILLESHLINTWLNEKYDGDLVPKENHVVDEMHQWVIWCDTILKPQIDIFKYGKNREFEKETHVADVNDLAEILQKLENHLTTRDYLVADQLTLADIAIIPFIRQIMRTRASQSASHSMAAREGEFDFTPFPQIQKWAGQILEQPWFDEIVMKK